MRQQRQSLKNAAVILFSAGLTVGLTGCGSGFKAGTASDNVSAAAVKANIDDQMNKAQQATKDAQLAIADAQVAIASISDKNGNIKVGLFSKATSETQTQGLLSPLLDRLQPVFDKVYAKGLLVKQRFDSARISLADAISKLDKNNPAQAAQIQTVMDEMAQIDQLELQFQTSMHTLASRLNYAMNAIDKLVSAATSLIPIPIVGWIAGMAIDYFIVDDVKTMIQNFQLKLMSI